MLVRKKNRNSFIQPPVKSILDSIGNTPIVELTHTDTGCCQLFMKLENQNPGGSIKDRIGLSMITAAEKAGKIKPGDTLIEATAGNTGLGLTLVARLKGYQIILVMPDKMSQEKINHLRAMGAQIVITRSDVAKGHPEYYQDYAERLARETGAYYVNQFENPANPLAHQTTTGPELWEQMDQQIDAVVVGVGSSGTLTGLTQFFTTQHKAPQFILADPEGSILADYINHGILREDAGTWLVEGIGEDFVPAIADFSLTKKAYTITDQQSFEAVRNLLKEEGIMAGSSTGTLLSAAIQYCQAQTEPKRVVTFACDSGNKYLSKMYNDLWLMDQGLVHKPHYGDLRDFVSHPITHNHIISVKPDDRLKTVYGKMKLYDISQLPVIENGDLKGVIDESDLLLALYGNQWNRETAVRDIMTKNIVTISYKDSLPSLLAILNEGLTAIVNDEKGNFWGLITKIDVVGKLYKDAAAQGSF